MWTGVLPKTVWRKDRPVSDCRDGWPPEMSVTYIPVVVEKQIFWSGPRTISRAPLLGVPRDQTPWDRVYAAGVVRVASGGLLHSTHQNGRPLGKRRRFL